MTDGLAAERPRPPALIASELEMTLRGYDPSIFLSPCCYERVRRKVGVS